MFEKCQRIGLIIMGGFTALLSILLGLWYIIPVNLKDTTISYGNSNTSTASILTNASIITKGTKTANFKQYPQTIEYLNKANMKELILLPGIGEVTANRIIDFRNKHPIKSTEDILNIKSIGIKKVEKIEEFLSTNSTSNNKSLNKKNNNNKNKNKKKNKKKLNSQFINTHDDSSIMIKPQTTSSSSYTRLNNQRIKNTPPTKYPLAIEYFSKASIEELTQLPGIGEALAKRIIEYKDKHFIKSYHDILSIKGIGIKKLKNIEEFLSKNSVTQENNNQTANKNELNSKPTNINTATYDDLIKIPGLGPVLAKSILNYRENKVNKEFEDIEELLQIKGIGRKKLEKLKSFITL